MTGTPRQRDRVLALVRDSLEPLDAPLIARALGIHITTARFHLNALIDEGLVEGTWLPSETVGRPRKGYVAAGADPAAPVLAALLAQLGDTPADRKAKAVVAGRMWADSLADVAEPAAGLPDPVTVVTMALTRLGFQVSESVSSFGTHEIRLCNCPLRRIAVGAPEIVIGIQQGLIERVLWRHSPALTEHYDVEVHPDPAGDCGVTLRLTGKSARSATAAR
ncbi:putative transcriptional regulator [Nocardia nova SH22a]|uniref:Putative transcriptional regulator n=1 Tax=Nocardia nova SH22a TaxID=1415166 RepID=W5T8C7_9NOCA|nr:transcriptional regulator [Nocardia nova]AHH15442.1 putative transcriptional regulator [Nocardia nova SH22a]